VTIIEDLHIRPTLNDTEHDRKARDGEAAMRKKRNHPAVHELTAKKNGFPRLPAQLSPMVTRAEWRYETRRLGPRPRTMALGSIRDVGRHAMRWMIPHGNPELREPVPDGTT
jgi:hypothetical protein